MNTLFNSMVLLWDLPFSFAMNMVESQISKCRLPLYYRRYVDDIFAIFKNKSEADDFLTNLNLIHKNFSFTIEKEKNHTLRLLDVMVIFQSSLLRLRGEFDLRILELTFLLKSMFCSHEILYKKSVLRSLFIRAKRPSSSQANYLIA